MSQDISNSEEEISSGEEEVKEILARRHNNKKERVEWKVSWKSGHNEWLPKENFISSDGTVNEQWEEFNKKWEESHLSKKRKLNSTQPTTTTNITTNIPIANITTTNITTTNITTTNSTTTNSTTTNSTTTNSTTTNSTTTNITTTNITTTNIPTLQLTVQDVIDLHNLLAHPDYSSLL
jgi:hypothetical protein